MDQEDEIDDLARDAQLFDTVLGRTGGRIKESLRATVGKSAVDSAGRAAARGDERRLRAYNSYLGQLNAGEQREGSPLETQSAVRRLKMRFKPDRSR